MACGGLPFPGTGCPIPDVDNLCLLCIEVYVWDAVSILNHLPRIFCPRILLFKQRTEQVTIHLIFTCYTEDNQQGVSGLTTDSPCGVWGRG